MLLGAPHVDPKAARNQVQVAAETCSPWPWSSYIRGGIGKAIADGDITLDRLEDALRRHRFVISKYQREPEDSTPADLRNALSDLKALSEDMWATATERSVRGQALALPVSGSVTFVGPSRVPNSPWWNGHMAACTDAALRCLSSLPIELDSRLLGPQGGEVRPSDATTVVLLPSLVAAQRARPRPGKGSGAVPPRTG